MAYLITVLDRNLSLIVVASAVARQIEKDGRFRLLYNQPKITSDYSGRKIDLGKIRLTKSKLYCGQHPGECLVGAKRKSTCLEWEDWIAFHAVVNGALDDLEVEANVTTKPMETVDRVKGLKGLFWTRKGLSRRVKYDWREEYRNGDWRPIRWWNPGTDDQFQQRIQHDMTRTVSAGSV